MSDRTSLVLQQLAWPLYLAAALLVVTPLVDLVANVWPIRLGAVEWRFGAFGVLSAFLLTPLIGMLLAIGAAVTLGHRGVLRALAAFNVLAAALLVVVTLLLALDWLQMRGTAAPDARSAVDVGSVKALGKHLTTAVLLGWLGVAGLRASRRQHARGREGTPLVRAEN